MIHRFRCLTFVALAALMAAVMAAAPTVPVAAEPPRVDHLATRSVPLTAQEQALMKAYAEYWFAQLATGKLENVNAAIRRLRDPLNQIGVTAIFRDEYSRAAVPEIDRLLSDAQTSSYVAVNAMQLAPTLGTEQAMRLLVNRSDPQVERRKAVRIWAARGFQMIAEAGHVRDRQLTTFLRDLLRSAQSETDWHVLLRQFEAINSVPDSMEQQLALLSTVIDRLERQDTASPQMQAVQRSLSLLLHDFIQMPVSNQRTFGMTAGATVGKVPAVAEMHWDEAQADVDAKVWYFRAISSTETLLRAIDASVRSTTPPRTTLDQAWDRGDRQAFERDSQQWRNVLQRQPYRQ